ncbi:NPH3 domain-containing protein [Cephalotus follicularis]|uniref:NPH3 domain-containing protein n=1 Tax=Cephalotus follicularis TaxID=3775 RepID=A0A1Q3DED2_CEPFO|nr:NPH3 domain-containing protein [Cephalotus follicularis]
MAADEKRSSKGQAWFCTTGLPSDFVIEVDDMSFHLHKFPLMSKSGLLHELITAQEANLKAQKTSSIAHTQKQEQQDEPEHEIEEEEEDEQEQEQDECHISLPPDFPGGSETFEMVAKFCYGVKIDLNSSTVVPLRCAGEFLEMTAEHSEGNLVSKTAIFLNQTVLKSFKESMKALKSCQRVMQMAESMGVVQSCINSITLGAPHADPALFGWPVMSSGVNETANQALWNGIDTKLHRKQQGTLRESWLEDLAELSLPIFKRLISAMGDRNVSPDIIESCLFYYARRYIPGISRSNRKPSSSLTTSLSSSTSISEREQRELLETIISSLPSGRSSRSSSTTRFLFGLLRSANILNASEDCRAALEKKIGSQLDEATLDDVLIPSYSYLNETLYDVDCIERILGYFLDGLPLEQDHGRSPAALMLVGKLIDGYLSEIASDANLKPDKFCNLATSLPHQARLFDDGLYRAVDFYLKAHPWLPEADREKICGLMDFQKLTLEACTHAAQNERLPLRAVVQVLFFEQLQLRHAIAGTLMAAESAPREPGRLSRVRREEEEEEEEEEDEENAGGEQEGSTWRAAVRENQVLRLDMDSMRTRVHQLERECSTMKKVMEKIDKTGPHGNGGWRRGSFSKKFGCKFKSQVCDSHESTVVDSRKGRHHHHQQ